MAEPGDKITAVVFDPKAPAFRRKLWVRITTPAGLRIAFIWPRIFKVLAVLLVAGWLVLAGALWGFVRYQRGVADARFVDVAFYPFRTAQYRATLGRHYLAAARLALEKHNWDEAVTGLRASLTYAPGILETRLILTEFYLRAQRPELALQVMGDGAAFARADHTYIKKLFRLCEEQRAFARIVLLGAELLPKPPDDTSEHRYIAQRTAAALIELRRYAEAEDLIKQWNLGQNSEGQHLLASLNIARDQTEEAVRRLELLLELEPRDENTILQLTRLYMKLGRLADAHRTAFLRSITHPASPGGHVDLLNIDWQLGRQDDFNRGVERFLQDFAGDATALALLAQIAADNALPELAARVLAIGRTTGKPPAIFLCALMQAQCAAGQYATALATAGELDRESGLPGRVTIALMALKCQAFYGTANEPEGDVWLHRFLSQREIAVGDALRLATALEGMGALKAAARVFSAAADHPDDSASALLALVEFHVRHNAWTEAGALLGRLKALPRPPTELIQNVESNVAALRGDSR